MNYRIFGIVLVFMGILLLIVGAVVSIDTLDDSRTRAQGAYFEFQTGRQSRAVKDLEKEKGANSRSLYLIGIVLIITGSAFVASSLASQKSKTSTMDNNNESISKNNQTAETEIKKCPACAEIIKAEAIKCRFCGELFDQLMVEKELEERKKRKANDEEERRKQLNIVLCPYCGKDTYKAYIEDGSWGDWCSACKRSVQSREAAERKASEQSEVRNRRMCPICNRETHKESFEDGKEVDWCQHCNISIQEVEQRAESKSTSVLTMFGLVLSMAIIIFIIALVNSTPIKSNVPIESKSTKDTINNSTPEDLSTPRSEVYKEYTYAMPPLLQKILKSTESFAASMNEYNSSHDSQQIIQKLDELNSESLVIIAQLVDTAPPDKFKYHHSRLTEGYKQYTYAFNKFKHSIMLESKTMSTEAVQEARSGEALIVSACNELAAMFKNAAQ